MEIIRWLAGAEQHEWMSQARNIQVGGGELAILGQRKVDDLTAADPTR